MAPLIHPDEMVDRWTLLLDEFALMHGMAGESRLGFALLLKFFPHAGRFPRGASELPDEAVEYVARQWRCRPATSACMNGRGARSSVTGPRSAPCWGSGSAASPMRTS